MPKFSAKNKIYLAAVLWLAACGILFGYAFPSFEGSNEVIANGVLEQKKSVVFLEYEQDTFVKGKQDLATLQTKTYQPELFFSKDVTLVNEIKTLEELSKNLGVDLNLSGLTGTIRNASKMQALGDVFVIPMTINVAGPFAKVVAFIEELEHLSFIINIKALTLNSSAGGNVNATLAGNFYLKK